MNLSRRLWAILCISLTVSSVALAEGPWPLSLLKKTDSYGERHQFLDKIPGLCEELSSGTADFKVRAQTQLEYFLNKKVRVLKSDVRELNFDLDAELLGPLPGFIRVFKTKDSFTFSFRKNEKAIEAMAVIYLSSDCQTFYGARFHYYNSSLRPVLRLGLDSLKRITSSVTLESEIQNPQLKTAENQIRVGFIDSGIDFNHAALIDKSRPFIGKDLTDPSRPPYDYATSYQEEMNATRFSHGSAVADVASRGVPMHIVVARIENKSHLAGEAVDYLAAQGVRLINISQGTRKEEVWQNLKMAIARHPEILFINSSGNDGLNLDEEKYYPSTFQFPNLVVVGSIDENGNLSRFSNYSANYVHFAALGENIKAALAGGGVSTYNGTSFSTPLVTRVAARILNENPNLTALQLREELVKRAQMKPQLSGKIQYGVISDLKEENQKKGGKEQINPLFKDSLTDIFKVGF